MIAAATTPETKEGIDVLPVRGGKRGAIRWIPKANDDTPLAGFVVIDTHTDRTGYRVTEFPTGRKDRGFMLTKCGGKGTDQKRAGYAVFCGERPEQDTCECEGFRNHRHCKHADSMRTLLMNHWL